MRKRLTKGIRSGKIFAESHDSLGDFTTPMFESRSKLTSGSYRNHRFECAPWGSVGAQRAEAPGFTLVELLVVITIVGVLASLLSTAFNNTRSRGQRISCINNLRQLQL